ncbi:pilus assembly protein TadG-related protein [Novipirellula artificiosorum]|uniref:Flp pilus-assembly TadG-like N-terminal domain-containing protein n=1 Tax=Novipirellula artificiosorum TaxID=2528016 RepID=A0A5C6D952_9BACT|nr:pilus assembly protein TadG-related protein [Novipirellula artificiosorum]TWU31736.1 hypothetical protein Poly41_59710 [Novipirellula artificiosorum]
MLHRPSMRRRSQRKGAIVVIAAILFPIFIAMLAFAVDSGYLLKKRSRLQHAADAAALAAVRDLVPDAYGDQDLDKVRATIRSFANLNVRDVGSFTVLGSDIEIGRYDPETIYSDVQLLDTGVFDTVRVTFRRDSSANSPVSLFFARIFGMDDSDVSATATAVLQKASILEPGVGVLPFSIPEDLWKATPDGNVWSIYGDGRMEDSSGGQLPGNWGTLNLGTSANSTATINDQVLNGLQQVHLDGLYAEGRIPQSNQIRSSHDFNANGDQGLSGGMKSSLHTVKGETKLIPLFDGVTNQGSVLEFHITGWAVCVVFDSHFHGSKNTYVEIQKSYTYNGILKPSSDLSVTEGVIEGAYTTPALVE